MRRVVRAGGAAIGVGCASLLSGCAVYHPRPLPTAPDLARVPAMTVPGSELGVAGLEPQLFDPARGLTQINVVTLAVADNPQLKAARLRAGVARAQLLEAGLLPDPRISASLARSALFTGYGATLSQDIRALITRGAARRAAGAHLEQVNLEILWQEWQVAERARALYIEAQALAKERALLDRQRRLLGRVYRRDQASLERGDTAVGDLTADFVAWNAAEGEWRSVELQDARTRAALEGLLGLAPGARLRLRGAPSEPLVTAAQLRAALATLPRRRPDLLALRAGYRSEEEQLREAILAQFPLVDAGVTRARSAEEGVRTVGFEVTLTLPLFNRNRGPIAAGRASRAYLRQAYQARLDEATAQADQVWQAGEIMRRQLERLDRRAASLKREASAARESLGRGTSTLADYARVDSNVLATEIEQARLRSALAQAQSALALLLALPF